NHVATALHGQLWSGMKRSCSSDLCGLLYGQQGPRRVLRCWGKSYANDPAARIQLNAFESSPFERQPDPERSNIHAHASGIERGDFDESVFYPYIPAKCLPAKLRIVYRVGSGVPGVTEEVRTIIAGNRIGFEHV